jgi:hypothetical protein
VRGRRDSRESTVSERNSMVWEGVECGMSRRGREREKEKKEEKEKSEKERRGEESKRKRRRSDRLE